MQVRALTVVTGMGTGNSAPVAWQGGRAVLVLDAAAYGTAVNLQVLSPSGAWISYNGTTYSANGIYPLDTAAGQHRMLTSGGTTTTLNATLVSVPYG